MRRVCAVAGAGAVIFPAHVRPCICHRTSAPLLQVPLAPRSTCSAHGRLRAWARWGPRGSYTSYWLPLQAQEGGVRGAGLQGCTHARALAGAGGGAGWGDKRRGKPQGPADRDEMAASSRPQCSGRRVRRSAPGSLRPATSGCRHGPCRGSYGRGCPAGGRAPRIGRALTVPVFLTRSPGPDTIRGPTAGLISFLIHVQSHDVRLKALYSQSPSQSPSISEAPL